MMFKIKNISFLISLLLVANCYAAEVISSFEEENIAVLNDELRDIQRRIRATEALSDLVSDVSGILPLANGGTNSALIDPDADRILFWDDSEDEMTFLTAGSGLLITGTTMTISSVGGVEIFTDTGSNTFTVPADVYLVDVIVQGGGGGGGGNVTSGGNAAGGGGGGCGWTEIPYIVTPESEITVIVGAGGAGGATGDNDGIDGGDSSFDGVIYGYGGDGGSGGQSGYSMTAAGFTAETLPGDTTDDTLGVIGFATTGRVGGFPQAQTYSGGGGSVYGPGGRGGNHPNLPLPPASGYGGGGGGATTNLPPYEGAAGASGIVIVKW